MRRCLLAVVLVLAVLGNGLTAHGRGVVRFLTDELWLALAAGLFECPRAPR